MGANDDADSRTHFAHAHGAWLRPRHDQGGFQQDPCDQSQMDSARSVSCRVASLDLQRDWAGCPISDLDRRAGGARASLFGGCSRGGGLWRLLHNCFRPTAIRGKLIRREWLFAVQAADWSATLALGRKCNRIHDPFRDPAGWVDRRDRQLVAEVRTWHIFPGLKSAAALPRDSRRASLPSPWPSSE